MSFIDKMKAVLFIVCTLILCGCINSSENVIDKIFDPEIKSVGDLRYTGNDFIHVGMLMVHVLGKTTNEFDVDVDFHLVNGYSIILRNYRRMLHSLLEHSSGTPLHLIFLTDPASVPVIQRATRDKIGDYISSIIIKDQNWNKEYLMTIPERLKVEFVDINSIVEGHRDLIDESKKLFGNHLEKTKLKSKDGHTWVASMKYTLDLFHIAPLYHLTFPPSLDRFIMLDVDLQFECDLSRLYEQFNNFEESAVIGVGFDQTPHYNDMVGHKYRKLHPGSTVGLPGNQGFNTGVVLYSLDKMRRSADYTGEIDPVKLRELVKEYPIYGTVGDQDWMTLLGFKSPHLFYKLPCGFNVQIDKRFKDSLDKNANVVERAQNFEDYACKERPLILHRNN